VLMTKETLWKNNANSAKDILVMYVHLIINVIIEYEKTKLEALLSYRTLYNKVFE
jgi:hypothetical protein